MKNGPAGHKNFQRLAGIQKRNEKRRRRQKMFEVVENEQGRLGHRHPHVILQAIDQWPGIFLAEAKNLGKRRPERVRFTDPGQADKRHAAMESIEDFRSRLYSEASLAGSTHTRQCDKPHIVATQ